MNYQIIIPARGGSKRFPGKNLALLNNKPLIQHTIEYALNNGFKNKIWVNTDDKNIANFSNIEGVNITIRPDELGGDYVPTIEVLKYQLAFFKENNIHCDALILLQATNPLRPINLLKDAVLKYESSNRKSLATFSSLNKKFGTIKNDFFNPKNYMPGQRSQDLEKLFFENGLLYITSKESILNGNIITDDVCPMLVDDIEANIDIDESSDIILAEFIIKTLNIKH